MAVYKRTYKGYSGEQTPTWSRFMILPRYSYARLFRSKFLLLFYIACFLYPLGCVGYIYIAHNLSFLKAFNTPANLLKVDNQFFIVYCSFQFAMAYLMTAFVGPGLVSPDLTNNALPLYLCRPFSRAEYVFGRMSVLLWILSTITWMPGLILFGVQWSLAGWDWAKDNWWLAWAVFAGLALWTVVLSFIAMAISSWIKWRIAAGVVIMAIFAIGAAFGAAINTVMHTKYGGLVDLSKANYAVWTNLFRLPVRGDSNLTPLEGWLALAGFTLLSLWLLTRKVRAFEVVK